MIGQSSMLADLASEAPKGQATPDLFRDINITIILPPDFPRTIKGNTVLFRNTTYSSFNFVDLSKARLESAQLPGIVIAHL
jgi:hypothetical protein